MKGFKFLRPPLIKAHDGGYINVGELFYTMNKEKLFYTVRGKVKVTPKYTIVRRCIHPDYKDVFKPDYDTLWYFRSRTNAEYLKGIWETQDGRDSI